MRNENSSLKYEDIIGLPHHVSEYRAKMPVYDRAAQFAPFAALSGHDDAICETSRLTDEKPELDENEKTLLDGKLRCLLDNADEKPIAVITYFVPDKKKSGGAYVSVSGTVKSADAIEGTVALTNGIIIPIENIIRVSCGIFDDLGGISEQSLNR